MGDKELKVTGLTRLPRDYKGEPLIMILDLEDIKGGLYESEIHMDEGYKPDTFLEACKETFRMCDFTVKRVHVRSVRIKK